MPTFEKKSIMPVSADALYDWHMQPGAFDTLVPPWQEIRVVERPERLEEGARLVMEVKFGPVGLEWVALHRDFIEGRQFVDEQVEGPFARWIHTHRFVPRGAEESDLIDRIDYELPLGSVGELFGEPIARRQLDRMFEYRHNVTRKALRRED